jgi:hypothetical protein
MATIVTRAGKGSPLTNTEVDDNFTNLNTDKLEKSGGTMTGDLTFGDNDKAIFGAGSDLQIYHDGSHSYVSDQGTGNIKVLADDYVLKNSADTELKIAAYSNAGVALYYDNSLKLATGATGVGVTGTVTADGLTVDGITVLDSAASSDVLTLKSNAGVNHKLTFQRGVIDVGSIEASFDGIYTNGYQIQKLRTGGTDRILIAANGDISFYEDTGTTPKFFWDASAESLGIGATNPTRTLQVVSTGTDTGGAYIYSNAIHTGTDTHSLLSVRSDNASSTGTVVDIRGDGTGDILNVKDSTNTALIVKDGGNVGIGTSSPSFQYGSGLEIEKGGYATLKLQNTAVTEGFYLLQDGGGNAYVWNYENDPVIFGTNATERMRIDSSGNVGIGTSSPGAPLEVVGRAYATSVLIRNSGGTPSLGTGPELYSPASGTLAIATATAERMRIDSSGNVGIGTSSPDAKLHVQSSVFSPLTNERTTSGYVSLDLYNSFDDTLQRISDVNGSLVFQQGKTSPTERMRIDSSGNVGVGTSSPEAILHVEGTSGGGAMQIGRDTGASQYQYINFGGNTAGDPAWQLGRSPSTGGVGGANNFYFYDLDNSATRLVITTSGNVGIGTSSPSAKLEVNGNAVIDGTMIVDNGTVSSNNLSVGTTVNNSGTNYGTISVNGGSYSGLYLMTNDTARFSIFQNSTAVTRLNTLGAWPLALGTNDTERMRIDSSGNVLVGKTSSSVSTVGAELNASGNIRGTVNGSVCAFFNRTTSDGGIVNFRKNNTDVVSIGVFNNDEPFFARQAGTISGIKLRNGAVLPCSTTGSDADNAQDIGLSNARWRNLYLSGGVYLGGTGAANYLDDYEIGEFDSPNPTGQNGGTINFLSSINRLSYTKVGDLVTVTGYLQVYSVTGTLSGGFVQFTGGLPFASADLTEYAGSSEIACAVGGTTLTAQWLVCSGGIAEGTSNFYIYNNTYAGNWMSAVQNGTVIRLCITYRAA